VGSGIFLSDDAPRRAAAIVGATTYWQDGKKLAEISTGLGPAMRGVAARGIAEEQRFAPRGW
jgi:pyridoxal 5'-phosphate synthase pdxS subunit